MESPARSSAPRLKSTYKPSAAALAAAAPLPAGWTEHKAPTGHTYYYNAETKESTYKRPGLPPPAPEPAPASYGPVYPHNLPNLADPHVANAYLAQFRPQPQVAPREAHRGGFQGRPRPQPVDKPRRKEAIPGCEPWILVYTKYSRRFVYNPVKQASYWRIPDKLMPAILELDKARLRAKTAEAQETVRQDEAKEKEAGEAPRAPQEAGDSSEYEEVEVTDDEAEQDEHSAKRQRKDDGVDEQAQGPVEFTEEDIAAQLQIMGADYELEPGDFDDGNMDEWPEGTEGVGISHEDAKSLFKDLLNDLKVNPYSPWETLLEQGKIIDDIRYTVLTTTRARKECWDEWSREKITALKQQRAAATTQYDPRAAYMTLLEEKATPKLYWAEFKRKYRKDDAMRSLHLTDREREKAYREHIARLRMPRDRLKADLTALLRAQTAETLRGGSMPAQVLGDVRWISLPGSVRDEIVDAYVQSLPVGGGVDQDESGARTDEARERRERALRERERVVDEQRRRREREVAVSKARLREGERDIEMAMQVDKRGLASQLREGRDE